MIFIHIGLSKAGSTTIQKFMSANETALRELSVDYPLLGRLDKIAHHNFAKEFKPQSKKFRPDAGRVSDLVTYLRETPYNTTVLSSESWWASKVEVIKSFAAGLADVGKPIRIIMVIRDLLEFAPSTYAQQVLRGGLTYDFDTYFDWKHKNNGFNVFCAARRWADAFGWDALIVRALDPATLVEGDLISDFLTQVGLDPRAPAVRDLPRQPRANVSPGWRTLEAVRALFTGHGGLDLGHPLRRLITEDMPIYRKARIAKAGEVVGGELGWNLDRGRYLTFEQAEILHGAYIGVLEALNERLPTKFPAPASLEATGFVAREFLPDASHIPAAELKGFYDLVAVLVDAAEKERAAEKVARKASSAPRSSNISPASPHGR
jgi:hypothetical protein